MNEIYLSIHTHTHTVLPLVIPLPYLMTVCSSGWGLLKEYTEHELMVAPGNMKYEKKSDKLYHKCNKKVPVNV